MVTASDRLYFTGCSVRHESFQVSVVDQIVVLGDNKRMQKQNLQRATKRGQNKTTSLSPGYSIRLPTEVKGGHDA